MQKEIVIVVIIVILIFATHILTQNYTKQSVFTINEKLKEIRVLAEQINALEQADNSELLNKVTNLRAEWENINNYMSLYIEHNELEKVNSHLVLMQSNFEMEEHTQGITELENCIYILQHIEEKQALKIINLF